MIQTKNFTVLDKSIFGCLKPNSGTFYSNIELDDSFLKIDSNTWYPFFEHFTASQYVRQKEKEQENSPQTEYANTTPFNG